ncbi:AAA family ATPase [soil metagenome]
MYLEQLKIRNFLCFGPDTVTISLDRRLTTFVGANAAGKTAACQALLRLFSVVPDQRIVRVEDFHVPHDESTAPTSRTLTIEAIFAFPELNPDDEDPYPADDEWVEEDEKKPGELGDLEGQDADVLGEESGAHGDALAAQSVPEFFAQMTADDHGVLKLRVVLEAEWVNEGPGNGTVETSRRVVYTFDDDYGDKWTELRASDRNRIQMVYVPATRDGVRQVNTFLRGRVWSAALWSESFREDVEVGASDLVDAFRKEEVVEIVTEAITGRWQGLHHLGLDQNLHLEPISTEVSALVSGAEMFFEPSATGRTRPANELSDGQQSLLHIALAAATLDLEAAIAAGEHDDTFDITSAALPTLTLLALEEPENNLAPFYLSRVIEQFLQVTRSGRAQALISSHSASVMSRIRPDQVRHLRLDSTTRTTAVREILMPEKGSEAGKYLREAVRAHPEVYFARFAVLGEGDSEEIVVPKLASARGLHIDQSFVAMIPLGGRHINHFWRLLRELEVPHATLLDLDYGRAGGGEGRIRYVCDQLIGVGEDPFDGIQGFDGLDDIDDLSLDHITIWMNHLEKWGVFFSAPLDLDFALLAKFKKAYTTHLDPGATGPKKTGDPRDRVLGEKGIRPDVAAWDDTKWDELLFWYRYLFLGQGKPSTHMRALTTLKRSELLEPPKRLGRLLDCIADAIGDQVP